MIRIKNRVKKTLAVFFAAAVMTFSIPVVSAADTKVNPSATDRATIEVGGIEAGVTVKAYQVVEAVYNNYGFVKYQTVEGVTIADVTNPTEAEVTALAKGIYNGSVTGLDEVSLVYNTTSETYTTADAEAGSYIVLVTNTTGEYVYNPCYVSNAYTDANDASTLGKEDEKPLVVTEDPADNTLTTANTAYAKKSHTTLDKDIVGASTGNTETEDVAVGDEVTFSVTTIVPDYSDGFPAVDFILNDTADEGLGTPNTFTVMADGKTLAATNYTLTVTDNDWIIDFKDAWVMSNPLSEIEVTYKAVVTEAASLYTSKGVENKAELTFTTVPGSSYRYDDTVTIYSFTIEANKIDEADGSALSDAEFVFAGTTNKGETVSKTVTSDADGVITLTGLDAGTYTIRESKAPTGYAISPKVYTITVEAEYDADLEGVIPHGTNEKIVKYTVQVTDEEGTAISDIDFAIPEQEGYYIGLDITNTTLVKLPTTGGNGTYLFTFAGVALVGAGVFMMTRKNKKNNEK